jgi:hypothetical protein
VTENPSGSYKETEGKRSNHFVPMSAVYALSDHMAKGALKYGHGNWRLGMPISQLIDATESHIAALRRGEWIDPASGSPHALAIMANAMIMHELECLGRLTHDHGEVFSEALDGVVALTPGCAALSRTPVDKMKSRSGTQKLHDTYSGHGGVET